MIFLITYFSFWVNIYPPFWSFFTNRPLQLPSCLAFAPFWPCPIHSLSTILRYPWNSVSKQQQNILLLLLLFLSKLLNLPMENWNSLLNRRKERNISSAQLLKRPQGSYEWIIMLEKCGRLDLTVFHLILVIGTYGTWKNQNPGGRFGATS